MLAISHAYKPRYDRRTVRMTIIIMKNYLHEKKKTTRIVYFTKIVMGSATEANTKKRIIYTPYMCLDTFFFFFSTYVQ